MDDRLRFMTSLEKDAIEKFVRSVKEALGESLVKVEMFGSKVRGDHAVDSDIDILILVTERTMGIMGTVAGITSEVNLEHNASVSPVVFSHGEYKTNLEMSASFPLAVEVEGVVL